MDIRILETLIAVASFFILRFVLIKILAKIQKKYDYSKYRIRPILKSANLFIFATLVIVLIAIWGVEQTNILTFITSVLTVLGVAFVAQWSILSNILSAIIIFVSHPVKLGQSITIIDKEFAPIITTPLELENKWGKLQAFAIKQKTQNYNSNILEV